MKKENPFRGCSISVTGKLEHFTRSDIHDMIRRLGGIVKTSVSHRTDYLICGNCPGSKLAKAQSLGIRILTEKEFLDMAA